MVKRLRVIDSQDSTRDKLSDRGAAAATKRKKILIDSEDEIEDATCFPPIVKDLHELPSIPSLSPEKKVSRKKRQSSVNTAQDRVAAPERPRRACVASNSSNTRANVEQKPYPSAAVDQPDSNMAETEKELTGGKFCSYFHHSRIWSVPLDTSRKRTPGENVAEQQELAGMVEPQSKGLATEADVPASSSKHGLPRKRARVEPENISPPRNRPHRSKRDASVSKHRKGVPSRVRKTYRKRQKIERSSPGHCVNRDVDYDEIPPSTVALNSPTAKGRTLPPKKSSDISTSTALQAKGTKGRTILQGSPMVGPRPADETPNDKKQEKGEPNQTDVLIQVLPSEVVLDDDDPIQSFSSSPSELPSVAVKAFNSLYLIRISCLNCTA